MLAWLEIKVACVITSNYFFICIFFCSFSPEIITTNSEVLSYSTETAMKANV